LLDGLFEHPDVMLDVRRTNNFRHLVGINRVFPHPAGSIVKP
jgi:hypothetical protein